MHLTTLHSTILYCTKIYYTTIQYATHHHERLFWWFQGVITAAYSPESPVSYFQSVHVSHPLILQLLNRSSWTQAQYGTELQIWMFKGLYVHLITTTKQQLNEKRREEKRRVNFKWVPNLEFLINLQNVRRLRRLDCMLRPFF